MATLAAQFKSKSRLKAENAALRHQLIVLRRKVPGRVRLTNNDRWFFIQLYRWFPSILKALTIIRPETFVRWHRTGFRCYWRWMGIRDKPTAPASPWQNGFAERLIGSIRRECVDHFIILGEAHLRRILRALDITMTSGRTDHWIKTRRSLAPFSGSDL